MILDSEIIIQLNNSNRGYYKSRGYNITDKEILVKLIDIPKGSHIKINCVCYFCNEISKVVYKNYIKQTIDSEYFCKNCKFEKIKDTIKKRYNSDTIRNINGVDEKISNTNIKKYGSISPFGNIGVRNKVRNTLQEKYGVDNVSKMENIKDSKKETYLINYGETHFFKTECFKKSVKSLFIERYGVDNPFKNIEIIRSIRNKHIESGFWVSDINYKKYRRRVDYHTSKNKSIILETWDGYDYYDGEYIRDFFSLDNNNNKYPSIDHKIPVIYGFINKIQECDIYDINNLCFTKRIINSFKRGVIEKDFKYECK